MAKLHQPLPEDLIQLARDLGRVNPRLAPLEHQLRKGEFDEQLGPHLQQVLERYRESPDARKSIERLIQAISYSIRAQIFQVAQVAPAAPTFPQSTDSWMRLEPGLFAQYSLQLVSNAATVQTREQAEQLVQQVQTVLEIAYRRWQRQSPPPLISGAVGQLQQALQHLQHRLESARRAAAQQGAPARHPSPSPEAPPAKAVSQEAWSLADLPPGWQQKMQDLLVHHAQQFIDQVLAPALAHKYDELEYIARGGMGMVLKARQKLGDGKGRVVALKLNMQMSDREMIQSFMNEGANAAQLGFHPNVVAVIDSNQAQVQFGDLPVPVLIPYHVFEFVKGAKDGTSLAESMAEAEQALPVEAALLLIQQAAKGLAAAHKKGIVHRDMKLENVLLPPDVQKLIKAWIKDRSHDPNKLRDGLQKISGLKVSDFGLAGVRSQQLQDIKSMEASEDIITDQHTLTGPNRVVGTAEYIPPEAYNDSSSAGKPWDVYSLGLVLYTLLTSDRHPLQYSKGVKPGKENIRSYFLKIGGDKTHSPAVASSEQDPNIKAFIQKDSRNKEVLAMLQRMTAYDPEERPTMEEVIEWVDEELERRSEKTVRMRRTKIGLGVAGAALLSLLASMPIINKSNRRESFFKAQEQALRTTKDLLSSQQWKEALALLESEREKTQQHLDLDASEKETRLKGLEQQIIFARSMEALAGVDLQLKSLRQQVEPAFSSPPAGVLGSLPGSETISVVSLGNSQQCLSPFRSLYAALQERQEFIDTKPSPFEDSEKETVQNRLNNLLGQLKALEVECAKPLALSAFRSGDRKAIDLYGIISSKATADDDRTLASAQIRLIRAQQQHSEGLEERFSLRFPENPVRESDALMAERKRILQELNTLLQGCRLTPDCAQVLRFFQEAYYKTQHIPDDPSWQTDAVEAFATAKPEARSRFATLVQDFDRYFRRSIGFRERLGASAFAPTQLPRQTPIGEIMDRLEMAWRCLDRLEELMGQRPLPAHDYVELFSDPRWAAIQDAHKTVEWFIQNHGGIGHLLDELKNHYGYAKKMQHFLAGSVMLFERTELALARGDIPALPSRQQSNLYFTLLHNLSLLHRVQEMTGNYLTPAEQQSTMVKGDYLTSPIFYQRIQEACISAPNKAERLNVVSQFHYILVRSGQNPAREARFLGLIRNVGLSADDLRQAGIELR
ncbi:MAG: serine/threonine-protein kinase [Candidatus Altimarinota bacterium]